MLMSSMMCVQVGLKHTDSYQLPACAVQHAAVCGAELAD